MKSKKLLLVIFIVIIILIVLGLLPILRHHDDKQAVLPLVEGLGLAEAEAQLNQYGFKYTIKYDYNNKYEEGIVISQEPKPHSANSDLYSLKKTVILTVNSKDK